MAALAACLLLFASPPATGTVASRAVAPGAKSSPMAAAGGPGCAALLDSLDRLHASDRADYLAWDFAAAGCDRPQLYRAYHGQGFRSLLAGDPQGAAPAQVFCVTHGAREGDVRTALAKIAALPVASAAPRLIRICE